MSAVNCRVCLNTASPIQNTVNTLSSINQNTKFPSSLQKSVKPRSGLWTSGRDSSGTTPLLRFAGPPWREWLQVPWSTHLCEPDPDSSHSSSSEQSQTTLVPTETAEEIQGLPRDPENFLYWGHRKFTYSVHLNVVQKLLNPGPQIAAESGALS